jgi:hypothetical protein
MTQFSHLKDFNTKVLFITVIREEFKYVEMTMHLHFPLIIISLSLHLLLSYFSKVI